MKSFDYWKQKESDSKLIEKINFIRDNIRKIIESYGWKIEEKGKKNQGVKFVISIPLKSNEEIDNYYLARRKE